MTPREHWRVVSELFNDALELPAGQRRDFLERSCDDQELLREVVELLADEERSGDGLLAQPYFSVHKCIAEEQVGRLIGPYRLLRRLGHGGMGAVYLAERADGEFEQQVAVKLLHPSLSSGEVMRRFRSERQILAKLSHPNVARLLDGGTTDDGFLQRGTSGGLPYFVMEYVDGQPIDAFCNAHSIPIRERLGLFRSLCAAVSFAHRNLVVHRDLKPGNILVTPEGQVKLLDFGLADLFEGEQPRTTREGLVLMTLPYASPEQIRDEAVSTASDVYSLGVVLYQLLTGRRPHEAENPDDLARAIRERSPRRPSAVEPGDRLRAGDPKRLRRRLAGDLDHIVLKALDKVPEQRFDSVEQLSDDVRRHLEDLPVRSRPDTFGYLAGKFIRRHRWRVAVAALVALLVSAFTVSTAVQNARIVHQNEEIARQVDQIRRERDRARSATEFLVDVLGTSDPRRAKGETPTVREVLDDTAVRLRTEMLDQPLIRAALLDAVGRVYHSLGLLEQARPPLEEALAVRREHLDADDPVLAESLHNLAGLERSDGGAEISESLIREAIGVQRVAFRGGHRDLARGLSNLASLLRRLGRPDEAEPLAREALEVQQQLFGEDHVDLAVTLNNLARILVDLGNFAEGEACFLRSIEIRREFEGADDPGLANTLNNLAMLLIGHLERSVEAEPLLRESLRIRRKVYGERHRRLVNPLNNLALLLTSLGQYEEARALFDDALAICADCPVRLVLRKNLALLLAASGDHAACEELIREVLPLLHSEHRIAEATSILGACLAGLGRRDEAEPLLREGYEALLAILGEHDRRTRQARERIAPEPAEAGLAPTPF